MTYQEKLKDPRWQKRRLKVMEYAKWRCQICGRKDSTLHCHHSYYTRGKEPWQYPEGSIICICEGCHEKIHGPKNKPEPSAAEVSYESPRDSALPEKAAKDKFAEIRASLARDEIDRRFAVVRALLGK